MLNTIRSRGEAIFKYLEIIQTLPMYAMHYYSVKVSLVLNMES